jgi:serine-type D-Ala-D-Ala carboxypeptidase/endopeptidase (penicillin-binding protein 4)
MARVARRLLALLLLLLAVASTAGASGSLSARLATALSASRAKTGAVAVDLASGRILFARNAAVSFVPASNEKLAVTYAALRLLGPGFRLRTEVLGEGSLDGTAWRGDLVLKGYGDPSLTIWGLRALASRVRALGVRQVTGGIVGDESYFDARRTAPGWKPSFYLGESPPLSALVVDRSRLDGRLTTKTALAAAILFRRELTRVGVAVAGPTRILRAGGFPLAIVYSPTLAQIVAFTDTESDNFTAEMLLKELGAVLASAGTTEAGAEIVRSELEAEGVPLTGVEIVDGSGLSSLDRLTPQALVAILELAWHDGQLRPFLASALAVAGRTGTLQNRLLRPPARGNVRAKTGSTNLASALSGYVRDRYAFSVIENGQPVSFASARAAQDRFVTVLAAQ